MVPAEIQTAGSASITSTAILTERFFTFVYGLIKDLYYI